MSKDEINQEVKELDIYKRITKCSECVYQEYDSYSPSGFSCSHKKTPTDQHEIPDEEDGGFAEGCPLSVAVDSKHMKYGKKVFVTGCSFGVGNKTGLDVFTMDDGLVFVFFRPIDHERDKIKRFNRWHHKDIVFTRLVLSRHAALAMFFSMCMILPNLILPKFAMKLYDKVFTITRNVEDI